MAPLVDTASGTGISPSICSWRAGWPAFLHGALAGDRCSSPQLGAARGAAGGRARSSQSLHGVDEPRVPQSLHRWTSPELPEPLWGGRAPDPRASTGVDKPRALEPLRVSLTLTLSLQGPRAISGRSRRRDATCQGPGWVTRVGKCSLRPVHQPFWPTLSRPRRQQPPCQSCRQGRPTPGHGAGREAGRHPAPSWECPPHACA